MSFLSIRYLASRTLLVAMAATTLTLTSSCHRDEREIEDSAFHYLQALADYDIDAARPYVTPETDSVTLNIFSKLLTMVTDDALDTPATITITKVWKTTDSTAVATFHKSTPRRQEGDSVRLRRLEGRWLVHNVIVVPPLVQMALNGGSDSTATPSAMPPHPARHGMDGNDKPIGKDPETAQRMRAKMKEALRRPVSDEEKARMIQMARQRKNAVIPTQQPDAKGATK